jgi:hypothetical protein
MSVLVPSLSSVLDIASPVVSSGVIDVFIGLSSSGLTIASSGTSGYSCGFLVI